MSVISQWTQLDLSEGNAVDKISYQLKLVYYGGIDVLTRKLTNNQRKPVSFDFSKTSVFVDASYFWWHSRELALPLAGCFCLFSTGFSLVSRLTPGEPSRMTHCSIVGGVSSTLTHLLLRDRTAMRYLLCLLQPPGDCEQITQVRGSPRKTGNTRRHIITHL